MSGFLLLQNLALESLLVFNVVSEAVELFMLVYYMSHCLMLADLYLALKLCELLQFTCVDMQCTNVSFLFTYLNKKCKLVHCISVLVICSHTEGLKYKIMVAQLIQ